jgi:hypothetical protein
MNQVFKMFLDRCTCTSSEEYLEYIATDEFAAFIPAPPDAYYPEHPHLKLYIEIPYANESICIVSMYYPVGQVLGSKEFPLNQVTVRDLIEFVNSQDWDAIVEGSRKK